MLTNVVHPSLLIERRDRLCPHPLPTTCVDCTVRHIAVHLAYCRLDKIAAVVDLGHDAVGLPITVGGHRALCPAEW